MTNDTIDTLISKYAAEYTAPVFYFCLRRTGSAAEAEDLAGEIALAVIEGLRKGTVPERFPAWVWQIVRNRYSKWAARTHKLSQLYEKDDVADIDPADRSDLAEELINSEQLSLLRRELAFTAREHRDIIVAYYIEQRKTEEIAKSLGISKGTVVSKLYRIRQKLKEGIEMSREFGVLSYNPENVGFIMNGKSGEFGEPWSLYSRALCKNLMLAAYRTPSTAEALAIELGVALPYTEDELELLVKSELMHKSENRYETTFPIVSARAQAAISKHLQSIAPSITQAVVAYSEYLFEARTVNNPKWHDGHQEFDDMKWYWLMAMCDHLTFALSGKHNKDLPRKNIGEFRQTIRPNGGQWDVVGLEDFHGERPAFVGLHSGDYYSPDFEFGQFKFKYKNIEQQTPVMLSREQVAALVTAAKGDVTGIERKYLDELIDFGYLDDILTPRFCVMRRSEQRELTETQQSQFDTLFGIAQNILEEHYQVCREVIRSEIANFLKTDEYQIAHAISAIINIRGAVLEEALRIGFLTYDESDQESAKRRMLGAYLVI